MIDHATEIRRILLDPPGLCSSLGLMTGAKTSGSNVSIRCPSHADHNPSCSVRLGPDGTIQVKCHGCDFAGDALSLIAKARGLSLDSAEDFREVMAIGAEIGGDLRLVDEIRTGNRDNDRKPAPAPEPLPERTYPEQSEVLDLWAAAHPCESAKVARELLQSRSIDPSAATSRGLLRVLPPGYECPPWANSKGVSWSDSGYRMIARVVDHLGAVRSLRAWQIEGHEGPKRKPPSGHKAAGLVLANREAAKMLAGKSKPKQVVICEGEPDWVTWATRAAESVAVIGIGSGSWTEAFASRLPQGCQVFVRTHCDPAGDKYAAHVIETIGDRCATWRLTPGKSGLWIDENDKAKAGKFPASPEVDCRPSNDAANKLESERPRILTVQQVLKDSYTRAANQTPPKILTTGHWKIDMLTGGIRPGFTWMMGADTSWGKTSWAIACADENLKKGARVLIVSLEDDESLYGDRLMARRSGVDAMRIRDRKVQPDDFQAMSRVVNEAENIPVYLDGRGITFERLLHQIERVIDDEGIDLTILDYVQEATTKQKYGDDRLMFKAIGQMFRNAVKSKKRAGIMLSQLTIADPAKPPTKRDIRECKDLASGAEVVALGWTPQVDVTRKNDNGETEVVYKSGDRVMLIDKAKDGRKGGAALDWDDKTASFRRVLRPFGTDGYEIPDFEATMSDLDDAIGAP